MKRLQHGLTLVEIAIALALATFLVTIGIPAYQNRLMRQMVAEAVEAASPAQATVKEYANLHGKLPTTEAIVMPFVSSKYVVGTAWTGLGTSGTITISTRSAPGSEQGALDAKSVVLTASYDAAGKRVEWVCGGTAATTIASQHLPANCKPL